MNLSDMRAVVRRDLHDENSGSYRWTNDEIDRHIGHAVRDFSEAVPYQQKANKATTSGSREVNISTITDRIMVEAVEYPVDKFPRRYQRFSLWADILTLLGDEIPDGSNACIYYGKLHSLGSSTSTIPAMYEDLIAAGAAGYAAVEWAIYAVNRVNISGLPAPDGFLNWGRDRLSYFRQELKRTSWRNQLRTRSFYRSYTPPVSKSADFGPS